MKTRTATLLLVLLASAAGAAPLDVRASADCEASDSRCPPPPSPPSPPSPARPPAPPAIPPVPASADADCAARKPGTRLRITLRPGETMHGVCRSEGGRMVFALRDYRLER